MRQLMGRTTSLSAAILWPMALALKVFIGPTMANKTNFDASTSFPPSPSPLVTSTLTSLHLPDTFIQKTKKLYQDTKTQRNMAKLNDELYEVHQIMTHNIQEVLGVGEKLNQVSQMSSRLTSESCIYADKAKDLNHQNRKREDITLEKALKLLKGKNVKKIGRPSH